jgi:hypothetical protein
MHFHHHGWATGSWELKTLCTQSLHRPGGLPESKSCGIGGRRYGQTENQAELSSQSASAGPGSLEIGGAQLPRNPEFGRQQLFNR